MDCELPDFDNSFGNRITANRRVGLVCSYGRCAIIFQQIHEDEEFMKFRV